jgi:hypothetical protein
MKSPASTSAPERAAAHPACLPILLGVASLLCFLIAFWPEGRPATAAPALVPAGPLLVSTQGMNLSYPPLWRAEVHSAFNAVCYLLDPRV